MAKAGKRFPLLIYEYTLSKWYPATLTLSIFLFILWWFQPSYLKTPPKNDLQEYVFLFMSGIALIMTIFIFVMRKSAYVRPYKKYLRLSTPFLKLNISYKRIIKTRATEMSTLFLSSKLSNWQRESMAHLLRRTALVVDLNAFPMPLPILRFFLSPFFFKDKTPHFVFLVEDWMRFSAEMESFRSGGDIVAKKEKDDIDSILSAISRDK